MCNARTCNAYVCVYVCVCCVCICLHGMYYVFVFISIVSEKKKKHEFFVVPYSSTMNTFVHTRRHDVHVHVHAFIIHFHEMRLRTSCLCTCMWNVHASDERFSPTRHVFVCATNAFILGEMDEKSNLRSFRKLK